MPPSTLLISHTGFLGAKLYEGLRSMGFEIWGTSRATPPLTPSSIVLDLCQPVKPQIQEILEKRACRCGILCAAMSNVETCFRQPVESRRVNVDAMLELLSVFKDFGIKPVFFSSDLVFDGARGMYEEDDPVSPTTVYGRQKAEIEGAIRRDFPDHLIFRTSKLMSMDLHPRSILTPVVQALREGKPVRMFEDQCVTPVFVEDIAIVLGRALKAGLNGTWHLGMETPLSRLEIARLLADRLGLDGSRISPIRLSEAAVSEPRGSKNTLRSEKITRALGFDFTPLEAGLDSFRPFHLDF